MASTMLSEHFFKPEEEYRFLQNQFRKDNITVTFLIVMIKYSTKESEGRKKWLTLVHGLREFSVEGIQSV